MNSPIYRYALKFLRWFCKDQLIDEIEGDLLELHAIRMEQRSGSKADRMLLWDVIRSFRLQNFKKLKIKGNFMNELIIYLKTYFRRFQRELSHYSANIIGLTLGFSVLTFVLLYVYHEWSIDKFHTKADRIFQVVEESTTENGTEFFTAGMNPLAETLAEEFSSVEETASFVYFGSSTFTYEDKNLASRNYAIVTNGIFNIWDINILHGDPHGTISTSTGLVLTADFASRMFGDKDPVGQVVETRFGNSPVLAIMESFPNNATYQPEIFFVADFSKWPEGFREFFDKWDTRFMQTWVLLQEGVDEKRAEVSFNKVLPKYLEDEKIREHKIHLQNITDIHLSSEYITPFGTEPLKAIPVSSEDFLMIILFTGIAVMLIAALNFINLSSVQALKRTQEAGIRKVNGANDFNLRLQLSLETLLTILISFSLAVILVIVLFPFFKDVTGKNIILQEYLDLRLIIILCSSFVFTWIISTYVPMLYYSRYSKVTLLGKNVFAGKGENLRKIFVVMQYTIAIVLIVFVFILERQMSFISNKDLGFDKSGLITLDINSGAARSKHKNIVNDLKNHSGIDNVTATSRVPGEWKDIPTATLSLTNNSGEVEASHYAFDANGIATLGINVVAGENFSGRDISDSLKVILNETAVGQLGLKNPIGKAIVVRTGQPIYMEIIGVVEDFHFQSLYEEVKPVFITSWNNPVRSIDYFVIRYSNEPQEALSISEEVNQQYDPGTPAEFHFLDEQWDRYYQADQTRTTLFKIAAGMSILISIIGLFGMISYTIERRTKEIGIRKVIGATTGNVIFLIGKDYLLLFAISTIIAVPFAVYFTGEWLQNFSYRIDQTFWLYLVAVVCVLMTSVLTILGRVIYFARINPVNAIRYE